MKFILIKTFSLIELSCLLQFQYQLQLYIQLAMPDSYSRVDDDDVSSSQCWLTHSSRHKKKKRNQKSWEKMKASSRNCNTLYCRYLAINPLSQQLYCILLQDPRYLHANSNILLFQKTHCVLVMKNYNHANQNLVHLY